MTIDGSEKNVTLYPPTNVAKQFFADLARGDIHVPEKARSRHVKLGLHALEASDFLGLIRGPRQRVRV